MQACTQPEFMSITHVEIPREKGPQHHEFSATGCIGASLKDDIFPFDVFFKEPGFIAA